MTPEKVVRTNLVRKVNAVAIVYNIANENIKPTNESQSKLIMQTETTNEGENAAGNNSESIYTGNTLNIIWENIKAFNLINF